MRKQPVFWGILLGTLVATLSLMLLIRSRVAKTIEPPLSRGPAAVSPSVEKRQVHDRNIESRRASWERAIAAVHDAKSNQSREDRPRQLVRPDISLAGIEPAAKWDGPWPTSLEEALHHPAAKKRIDRMLEQEDPTGGGKQGAENMDYKLKFYSRLRRCLEAAGVNGPGDVLLHLVFSVDWPSRTLEGVEINPIDSTLDPTEDGPFMRCAAAEHLGKRAAWMRDQPPARGLFYLGATIHVPLKDDRIFSWLMGP